MDDLGKPTDLVAVRLTRHLVKHSMRQKTLGTVSRLESAMRSAAAKYVLAAGLKLFHGDVDLCLADVERGQEADRLARP